MSSSDSSGPKAAVPSGSSRSRHAGPPAIGWAGWLLAVLTLITGLATGAWATQHWLGRQIQARHLAQQQTLQNEFQRVRADLITQQTRADTLAGQLVVERSTLQGLQEALQKAQQELGVERDKVAFYEQLIPPGPQGAVVVRALDIEPQGPILRYRAVLMHNARQQQPFVGRLQFIARGTRQGKSTELELLPARSPAVSAQQTKAASQAASAFGPAGNTVVQQASGNSADLSGNNNLLSVSFEQFQRSTGLLQLPPDFLPDQVTLNVLEGDTVRASRSVKLDAQASD